MISVALCTFNGEKYISEQIESILQQTVVPDEIVICDDNSNDDTIKVIINNFSDNRIKVFRNDENLGVTKNFEKCISLCKGDYVFLSDQDDIWENNKVETIIKIFDNQPNINLIFSDALLIDSYGNELPNSLWKSIGFDCMKHFKNNLSSFLGKRYVTGATVAIRRQFALSTFPIPECWIHDAWLAICSSLSHSCYCLKKKTIKYRQHDNNVIGCKKVSTKIKIQERTKNSVKIMKDENYMFLRYKTFKEKFDQLLDEKDKKKLNKCLKFWGDVVTTHKCNKLKALIIVLKNWMKGEYRLYYNGFKSVISGILVIFYR